MYDGLCYFDMFGESISFNVRGKEKYKTCLGSLVTMFIYMWCVLFFLAGIREFRDREKVPQINEMYKYNAYEPEEPLYADEYEFLFAFGVTTGHNFNEPADITDYGELKLGYRITKNDDTSLETYEKIEFEKCKSGDTFHTYSPSVDKIRKINKMYNHGVFYCPKEPDEISFYGSFFSESYKMLEIAIEKYDVPGVTEFFENVNLVLVINDKVVVYDETTDTPELRSYSDFKAFPVRASNPVRNVISVQRSWFRPFMSAAERMWFNEPEGEDYLSIPSELIETVAIGSYGLS